MVARYFCYIFVLGASICWANNSSTRDLLIFPEDEWQVTDPGELGIVPEKVDKLLDLAFEDPATQAAVLIQGGRLVGERYLEGFNKQSFGTSWSMAKSFYAALIGISIDRGEIDSLDDKVSKYIEAFRDERSDITIRHLLDMASGLDFPEHEHEIMFFQDDHLDYALNTGRGKEPGSVFEYNNVNSMLLGEILLQATGSKADVLMRDRIFKKIGIDQYTLWRDHSGNVMTYCCIDMTARDYARFGLLFARNGLWGTQQVISKRYVDESFKEVWSDLPSATINQKRGYGMHWWVSRNDENAQVFNASGKFGQYIFVDRDKDLVFSRVTRYQSTGGNVQNWGSLRSITWITDVNWFRKIAEFLARIGVVDPDDVSSPLTFEEGVSNQFFVNYDSIVDAFVAVGR